MALSEEDRKREILEQLSQLVAERLPEDETELATRFIEQYFQHVPPNDLANRALNDVYGTALAHYRFAMRRAAETPLIRAYNPKIDRHGWQSTHTIVEVTTDDMPFLVDSVANALTNLKLGVHLIVHPVLKVERDNEGRMTGIGAPDADGDQTVESFMHFEVDRRSDEDFLSRIEQDLTQVLQDVRHAVTDWREMRARVDVAIAELQGARHHIGAEEMDEVEAFARWLADNQFTFLGFSAYALEDDKKLGLQLRRIKGSGLGILRGYDEGLLSKSFKAMPESARTRAQRPNPPIVISKAHAKSTVHRSSYLDYVGIKRFGDDGAVIGESRFLGLFTSAAYNLSPRFIPLLRRKVAQIIERSGHARAGHAGKALTNVLETYPRDELFQTSEDELLGIARKVLYIQDRQQIRLFLRQDQFERFVSCLVFVPRERYTTMLRERIQQILEEQLDGSDTEFQAQVSESPLARIQFIVRTPKGIPDEIDEEALEQQLVDESRSWADHLREALDDALGEEAGNSTFHRYNRAFSTSYMEQVSARLAVTDIQAIDALKSDGDHLSLSLFRKLEDPRRIIRFKVIRADQPAHLADVLPILENMGGRVLFEMPFDIKRDDGRCFSIHDFGLEPELGGDVDVERLRQPFQETFQAVWSGALENDGFNKLVLAAGLGPRSIVMLRAYAKYLQQIGIPFSQNYIEQTLVNNAGIAGLLVDLFNNRFDPAVSGDRAALHAAAEQGIHAALEQVSSLDEDRILRRYLELINATLRTNAFQAQAGQSSPGLLSLKLDPASVPGMPLPRPAFEIFVYAPDVEGVHLRGGKVARGGLRWSDRREDFRTEILGLMKAQMVKNGVIVPVGAKGGFVVKNPPPGNDRAAFLDEGIRCYKMFLSGLLDITDNQVKGALVPPENVVRYDGDDPYLVVAADKGTATFSDIANGVSERRGFWLGDAFASGGSDGYDHKGMGITAKGAWESVKRHFRELGTDCQTEPFTVAGVGDMSGDVFGNGMLLSPVIRLVAAFDHRHIFLDPDPDHVTSFAERQRMFDLPRSSWDDYNRDLISKGGGIYPRSAKSIELSPQAQKAIGISAASMTPHELLNAILKAPVDLLWNGGIGTYVKAAKEAHVEAQDRANDAIRVDAEELRCKVVGEGGNLGLTQAARIAFAVKGGRINTDFIDNSAGVDCSDHEVNIKILLGEVVANGDLTLKHRNTFLAEMTDEVGDLCLRDNILQNLALSMIGVDPAGHLDAQIRMMHKLEGTGRLNRVIEQLPEDGELSERAKQGRGLSRPESAVLLSYAKMELYDRLLETDVPDHPCLRSDLAKYFPRPLRRRFHDHIQNHRLSREIIATWLANSMVNRGLETFVSEMEDESGAALEDIALAYVVARDTLGVLPLLSRIENLPHEVPAELQINMLCNARSVLMQGTRWFIARKVNPANIQATINAFDAGITEMVGDIDNMLSGEHAVMFAGTKAGLIEAGVPSEIAARVAGLPHLMPLADAETVAASLDSEHGAKPGRRAEVGAMYFALDQTLRLPWLKAQFGRAGVQGGWDRLALNMLEDDISAMLRRLTKHAVDAGIMIPKASGDGDTTTSNDLGAWCENLIGYRRYQQLLDEVENSATIGLGMLTVAVKALASLRTD